MASHNFWNTYGAEFAKSKSGVIGLLMVLALLMISVYAVATIPPSTASEWNNPNAWTANPSAAPPTWANYVGFDAPPSLPVALENWTPSPSSSAAAAAAGGPITYTYTASAPVPWDHAVLPRNLLFVPQFNGSVYEAAVTWTKPDGVSLQMVIASPTAGTSYDLTSPQVEQYLLQFAQSQTGTLLGSISTAQELAALFGRDGPGLLTNQVLQGTYLVTVQIVAGARQTVSQTALTVVGDSYGTMGTDNFGRPISLAILVGLPSALELGAFTSVVSVLVGVTLGGLAGFLGGKRDGVLQWVFLVVLALPALPFLIALSYSVTLSLLSEAALISVLSWPFYAIIARSASLSIKSQAYVEADRAMGVSSLRTFGSHFLPRLTPFAVAYTALGVPGGIILGQTLAFLGIQPANVLTWGELLDNAFTYEAALYGWWWWILFPGVMIVVASIPFVLVGFSLDKIVAPRVSAK